MRSGDKKGIICLVAALVTGWLAYDLSRPFFHQQIGTLMGMRFSDMISLFYAVTAAGIVFVILMFFLGGKEEKGRKPRIVRVKRFKL